MSSHLEGCQHRRDPKKSSMWKPSSGGGGLVPLVSHYPWANSTAMQMLHTHPWAHGGGGKPLQVTRKMWSRSGLHPWLLGMVFLHGVPRAGDTGGKLVGLSIVKPSWAAANSCVCWWGGVCVFLEQMNKSLSKFQALCKHPVERKTARLWNEREIRKIVGLC